MLTPDYYEDCADDIIELYAQLDEAIIADITRRIIKTGTVTETAKWQIKQAQEMGLLYDDIISEIGRRTNATDAHVRALFEDAGVRTVQYDAGIYRQAGLVPVDIRQSPAMMQVLNAGYKKTLGKMRELTGTTAVTSQTAYINACNNAYMKITSGAFSYQEAIKQAIQTAAQQGSTVLYPSGHIDRLDVAVRRAVLTGVGQTCRTISETNADEMGCDLMEISAHSGARPTHAEWQGQIVSLSGRKGYLTKDAIGYGTGAGFGGYNCQHDWYPYFEGISTRNYNDRMLKQMNAKCIEYNNKMYSEYEISQIQRRMEREIRSAKREKVAYQTAVVESSGELKNVMQEALAYSNSLVKVKQAKMRDFINQTGQQRQYFREQNYGRVSYSNRLTSDNNRVIIKEKGGRYAVGSTAWFKQQERRDKQAEKAYQEIAKADNIQKIADVSGMSIEEVQQIKNHVFFDEHILYDGKSRFFPDYNMAVAFKRLENGTPEERDILLLKHELFESQCEKKYNLTASEAHAMATEKYDWNGSLKKIFGEDGEPDDLL